MSLMRISKINDNVFGPLFLLDANLLLYQDTISRYGEIKITLHINKTSE